MRIFYLLIFLALTTNSCQKQEQDATPEDYATLFPFKGIDSPDEKGELIITQCNPDLILADYTYPGDETPSDANEYSVTLTCSFTEQNIRGELAKIPLSQYVVTFINEKKELLTISSIPEELDTGANPYRRMKNGQTVSVSFKVKSGYPLYLSVSGGGPDSSGIKASIKAEVEDGSFEIPELKTELYQNKIGFYALDRPYCEYIKLP